MLNISEVEVLTRKRGSAHLEASLGPMEVTTGWGSVNNFYLRRGIANPTAGDGQVTLNWTALDVTGALEIEHYEYRYKVGTEDFGYWQVMLVNAGEGQLAHTVTGLNNGTAYTFQIRAVSLLGDGPESSEVSSTPMAPTPDPPPGP